MAQLKTKSKKPKSQKTTHWKAKGSTPPAKGGLLAGTPAPGAFSKIVSPNPPGGLVQPKGPAAPAAPAQQAPNGVFNPLAGPQAAAHGQAMIDTAALNTGFDVGKANLDTQFFDPANEFSEANKIKQAEEVARKRALNAAGAHLYGGAMVSADEAISRNTREGQYSMNERYKQLLQALKDKRDTGVHDILTHVNDVDLQAAIATASDPLNTTPGAKLPAATPAEPTAAQVVSAIAQRQKAGTAPTKADSMTFARAIANDLWKKGTKSGKQWRVVLQTLGYDPRKGGKLVFK